MKFRITTYIALLSFLILPTCKPAAQLHATSQITKIKNINSNWQYLENNLTDIHELVHQTKWETLDLPHTWNQWDAVDMLPGYRRDASWYQKEIFIEANQNKNYILYFEGVNISSKIYINGQLAGSHIGGYVGFEIDITQWIKPATKNLISIRVDNSYDPNIIPSQKADFFIYGGITRDVWLKTLPDYYIKSVKISTPVVSNSTAETKISVQTNKLVNQKAYSIKSQIIDPYTNKIVSEQSISYDDLDQKGYFNLPSIKQPKLWSPENPNLYFVKTQLLENNKIVDERTDKIGYRWYEFKDNGPFFLNGKRLLIRGTHRHEEHAGFGSAMSNKLHRKDIEQIKEMGANFIRLAHYPQDPEIYAACDELGLIVWDELPWCRGGKGGQEWESNTKRLLKEQINQNFNHPSIFFWSLGNEIYWLPDFEHGDDEVELNAFVSKLNKIAHDLDPSRLTAIRKYYAGFDLVDVFSPSIWSGWYAGVYTNYENAISKAQKKYKKLLHMEYGGASHLGRHTENPIDGNGSVNPNEWAEATNQVNVKNVAKSGDWSENYIVDLFDWHLGITEQKLDFTGNAQWAYKDFGTPLRPENAIPYLNQKGVVDRAGNPKDAYYVFKSYWGKTPFVYVESHTWTKRSGPKNKKREICVFSNCDEVEFIFNGKNIGKKKRIIGDFPANGLRWKVLFESGDNSIIANGFKANKMIATDTIKVNYSYIQTTKPDHIELSSHVLDNGNFLIEAIMRDKSGQQVLDYEKAVYFSRDGQGKLLKNYGTPTRSQIIQMANGRAAIELKPNKIGKAIIECRNQDFKGSYLIIDFEK